MRRTFALFAALVLFPLSVSAQTFPPIAGYVTDAAQVLSADTKAALEAELAALDASTTEQVAVVTVPDMGGDYIEHYASKLFETWGIGEAKKDTGVLLLLAIQERELRIEVGYGLEGALPDSVANRIIQDDMVPLLRSGDYDGAVQHGVQSIIAAVQGEYVAGPEDESSGFDPLTLLVFGVFGFQWLAAILGRTKEWWLGGVVGGLGGAFLSTLLGWWLTSGAIATAALIVVGLLFDYMVSNATARAARTGSVSPWWSGGGSFGGPRSGGFGGFGGGMSGGGGASGRW